jgi:hypothetical protein
MVGLSLKMLTNYRNLVLPVMVIAMTMPVAASPIFSYTGDFIFDNDVALVSFSVLKPSNVTLQTFGFGGGTNGNGVVIAAGGFESMVQVFSNPDGVPVTSTILPGPDPTCGPRTPDPNRLNFCFDVYAQIILTPGDYTVALTQSPNTSNGPTLSDGFLYDGVPDFNSGFVGTFGFQGDGHWALDVGINPIGDNTVPEPGSALLVAPALLLAGFSMRRRGLSFLREWKTGSSR